MLYDRKTLNHMRGSSTWKLSHFESHRKALRSYSCTVAVNNLYSYLLEVIPLLYTPVGRQYPRLRLFIFSLLIWVLNWIGAGLATFVAGSCIVYSFLKELGTFKTASSMKNLEKKSERSIIENSIEAIGVTT